MKKLFLIFLFPLVVAAYGQEKYALVIGNSHYTNFGTLQNTVNDANDMADVLKSLGFNVELVKDATLTQMENSAIQLKNRLSEAGNDSIGFFYYAGHGLEKDGVNYLVPADANIPDSIFLRERAFSVQIMLDALNDSRNALNIIVLDACRNFPAAWNRSLDRGLTIINDPPANHIIMYATGAGKVANDGASGKNGLFTGYLLNNLRQHYDVNEVFRKTMVDVADASNNEQRPALYTDFGKTLYLQPMPALTQDTKQPAPVQQAPSLSQGPKLDQKQETSPYNIAPNSQFVPGQLDLYLNQIPDGYGPDTIFFTTKTQRQSYILDGESAGLADIKLRISNGEDPFAIHSDLLQGIQDQLQKQKTVFAVGWVPYIIGLGLIISSMVPITIDNSKASNWLLTGALFGSGTAITVVTLRIVPATYLKGVNKIANMRAQASYIETNVVNH